MIDPQLLAPLIRRWERSSKLSPEDRDALAALPWVSRTFERDSYLVHEGQSARDCALLLSGFAYRQKIVRDGRRQIISIHIPGEFVDLQNLLLAEADHSVQSLNRVEAALVAKSALSALAAGRPAIGKAMWLDTLIDSSVFREWVVNVGRRDARSRIAHLLCELALRLDASGAASGGPYEFPLTQEQLADATALTSVHTNRILQGLRKDGLVTLTANTLTVLDWARLRHEGDFNERYLHHSALHADRPAPRSPIAAR